MCHTWLIRDSPFLRHISATTWATSTRQRKGYSTRTSTCKPSWNTARSSALFLILHMPRIKQEICKMEELPLNAFQVFLLFRSLNDIFSCEVTKCDYSEGLKIWFSFPPTNGDDQKWDINNSILKSHLQKAQIHAVLKQHLVCLNVHEDLNHV